jgi:hypothetical protein
LQKINHSKKSGLMENQSPIKMCKGGGGEKSDQDDPRPKVPQVTKSQKAGGLVEIITPENPKDFFISGINVYNRPKPMCSRSDQESKAATHELENKARRMDPKDHFTAYLYGAKTTIQIPVEKHCYLRVPMAWIVYQTSQHFIDGFLDHLVQTLAHKQAREFRRTIRATMVLRRHGIGYKPKIASPPTADSASFPFLHIFCSNPCLYSMIKSKMSSDSTKRKYMCREFYQKLFAGGHAAKYLLTFRTPYGVKSRSNVTPNCKMLDIPKYRECFVAHEMDLNSDTIILSNLGITSNGWVRVTKGQLFDNRVRTQAVANSSFEITGDVVASGISLTEIEETKWDDLVEVALDIECHSVSRGFPEYTNTGDVVNYVGLVKYSALDMNNKETHCLCLGDVDIRSTDDGKTVDTAHMHVFKHETELLNYIPKFMNENDVDVIKTYFGNNFDWRYLDGRGTLASFVQKCPDLEMFLRCVQSYHRAHMVYKDLQGTLIDAEERFRDYGEISSKQYTEQSRDIFTEMNETLGFGQRRAWREPQPKTVHYALWGLWPKEFPDTPLNLRKLNEEEAMLKSEQMYEYFASQPAVQYHYMHRLRAVKGNLVYKNMGSKAMGENFLMYPDLGRVHIDQFAFFKNSMFRLSGGQVPRGDQVRHAVQAAV